MILRIAYLLAVCTASAARPLSAQGPVHVTGTLVRADIVDGASTTTIERTFANAGSRAAEAVWTLPVPAGAAADDFAMQVDGKEMQAELHDAATARQTYLEIVRRRRDPGLLEYIGKGLLQARVFPIPAGGSVKVTVRLRQHLEATDGKVEWWLPLRALRTGSDAVDQGTIGVDVQITSTTAISQVFTSRRDAEILRKGEQAARVGFEIAPQDAVDRDLQVIYTLAKGEFGLHALTWRNSEDAGYFLMFASPERALPAELRPRRCVQFVVDVSGSMEKDDKLPQTRRALHGFLDNLRPDDTFQVVPFATEPRPWFATPVAATAANLTAARGQVDALTPAGGTNIDAALTSAFAAADRALADDPERLSLIVFLTDGAPTVGVTAADQLRARATRNNKSNSRIFIFGVGDDVNALLLDDLANEHRGSREYVRRNESIEREVQALCARIAEPAMTDIAVRCDVPGFELRHAAHDLFAGDVLELVGRYRGTGSHLVKVAGTVGGERREFEFAVEFPAHATQHDFVRQAWARREIAVLLEEIRRKGNDQELVAAVRQLAREHGIATPFTSHLILEDGMSLTGAGPTGVGPWPGTYRGPGDVQPPFPGPGGGGGGGATPAPGGPATGGPTGPPSSPAGPTSGGRAVDISEELHGSANFFLGASRRAASGAATPRRQPAVQVRRAADRTFVLADGCWVESGLPKTWRADATIVIAYSPAWLQLLDDKGALREVLALGEHVAFRHGDGVVLVKPAADAAPRSRADAAPTQTVERGRPER